MQLFRKLISSDIGRMLLSILLGLGLSAVFKKSCDGKNCLVYRAPEPKDIKDKTFVYNKKCYTFDEEQVKCNNKAKQVMME